MKEAAENKILLVVNNWTDTEHFSFQNAKLNARVLWPGEIMSQKQQEKGEINVETNKEKHFSELALRSAQFKQWILIDGKMP